MLHHDTESRLLLAREHADLLANEMLAASLGTALRGLTRQVLTERAAESARPSKARRPSELRPT
jgi:hypothetical protein